jgi:flagellar biogenesis protein FliO
LSRPRKRNGASPKALAATDITDFIEAFSLTSWLLWIKLLILIALWRLRKLVRQRWYPTSRLH